MGIENVYTLKYDKERRKYYFLDGDSKKYLSRGDKVTIIYANEEKKGIIGHSKAINKGYYLLLDSKSYIPLFLAEKIKLV